ncbi:MAG: TylF/MycF/NovP-related O-methyltransferase [Promethearchaeota archaeon]
MIALLYLDFDLYEPTKVALEHFFPLVPKGGIVAFDELNALKWVGETKALKEFFDINKIRLRKFPFNGWGSYFIVDG